MLHLPIVIDRDGEKEVAYDLYSRLLKDRIIFIGTPINDHVANAVIAQLLFLESQDPDKDIFMYINSPGGGVMAGLGIYDTMQYVKPDITTICTGHAMSMGCFLLSAGASGKRFSLPHARIMMHSVHGAFQGSAPDMRIQAKEVDYLEHDLFSLLAQHCNKPIDAIKEEFQREVYMSPKEAMKFGIIDAIHHKSVRGAHE